MRITSLCLTAVLSILAATGGAYALPAQSDHGVLQAVPVPGGAGSVTIDGTLGEKEWDTTPRMYVYNAVKIRHRYSVEVFSMWDPGALYLGLHFKDPTPLINNVDADSAPFDGWQSDGLQCRFTTDYGQIHMDAWYSSRKDASVAAISYDAPLNRANCKIFHGRGKGVRDGSGFQMAFKKDSDNRGYVQEIRIPWTLLYRKVPKIAGGLKFRFTGEYYWGGPTGIKWPKVMWADPINPKQPVRIVIYQNWNVWGTLELLAKGNLPSRGDDEEEETKLQGLIAVRVEVPADARRFSLVIDDVQGRRVRNLASHAEVKTYQVGVKGDKKVLEVPWDGRAEGQWDKQRSLFLGDYVPPGRYSVRVLTHGGVGVVHAGSFYNPGTPPWPTSDGSGSWLSDHAQTTDVAVMGPTATTTGRTFLMAPHAESGVAYIGLDTKGKKIWEWTRNATHMHAVAGSQKYGYFAFAYVGKPFLGRLDADKGVQVPFAGNLQDIPLPAHATGLAVHGKHLAVSIHGSNEVLILDAKSGKHVKKITVAKATDLSFTADGRLIGRSDSKLLVADVGSGRVTTFTVAGVEKPAAIACDGGGRLYVSDPATGTVKVFDRIGAGARLVQTVGTPGGRPVGRYNPLQMAAPLALAVDERPDGTKHLWCVENNNQLRRTVVWDVSKAPATIVRDYIGGTYYCGSGGLLSDDVPDMGLFNGVIFKIDYENYDYHPVEVMGGRPQPRPRKVALFGTGSGLGAFANGFHFFSKAGGKQVEYYVEGNRCPLVFLRRAGRWLCVAAMGNAGQGIRFPKGFPQPEGSKNVFCWNDLNRNGYQEPEEVSWHNLGDPHVFRHGMSWGYRCDRNLNWYHNGLAIAPVRFMADGAPVYDLSKVRRLPGELGSRPQPGEIRKTHFGYILQAHKPGDQDPHGTIHGLIQLEGYDNSGKLRWTYPAYWHSVHGAFTAPMAIPGVIMGALKITGIIDMGDYSIISLHGNIGQEFLIRDDGLYVGELFTDQRMAPDPLPSEERIAGVPINDTTLGGEPFSGWISRQSDGKVRMSYGLNDVRIAEVTGLDGIRVSPAQPLAIGAKDVADARRFVPKKTGPVTTTAYGIVAGGPFDPNQITFGAGAISIRAGREEVAKAVMRYDQKNLYVAWQVSDMTPLVNRGDAPELAFKSGDSVSLFVAPDGQHDKNTLGGTRVLLAEMAGNKRVAVVYRPGGPGNKPFVFESPVRKSPFQYVAVEPAVSFDTKKGKHDYILTAAVPWSVLGVTPRKGLKLRGDLGTIAGRETTNYVERIVRWVDKQTNVVNDVPTEAEFFPGRWGTFILK